MNLTPIMERHAGEKKRSANTVLPSPLELSMNSPQSALPPMMPWVDATPPPSAIFNALASSSPIYIPKPRRFTNSEGIEKREEFGFSVLKGPDPVMTSVVVDEWEAERKKPLDASLMIEKPFLVDNRNGSNELAAAAFDAKREADWNRCKGQIFKSPYDPKDDCVDLDVKPLTPPPGIVQIPQMKKVAKKAWASLAEMDSDSDA